jgi:dTDP-4-dehydrorhamnose reductase
LSDATRVIVIGAAGQLGMQVVARLQSSARWQVAAYDLPDLDITSADRAREVLAPQRARWLINTAAMTQVDLCESRAQEANAVNADAVATLASICNESDTALVQVSTDYVFDGRASRSYREDDPANPINAYARSKWQGELHARSARRHLIMRTAWLYGPRGRNFVDTILAKAAAGEALRVVDDQTGSPSYARDMAECLERLMRIDAEGVFHVTNSGQATWYDLARKATELAGLCVDIEPVTTDAYPTPARRPPYSVLNCSRYTDATGHRLRAWDLALEEYVRTGRAG